MRIKLSQWDSLSPAQRAEVTHIVIDDQDDLRCNRSLSEFEEYPGEAESRGVTERGFNK